MALLSRSVRRRLFSSQMLLASSLVDEVADSDLAAEGRAFLLLELGHRRDGSGNIGAGHAGGGGHQAGDRLAVAGDGDGFAVLDPLQKLGQVGLGFVRTDSVDKTS
jgi:hypothetical protein